MTTQTIGLLIGGGIPAVLFGLSTVFNKSSVLAGISLGFYMLSVGLAVMLVGGVLYAMEAEHIVTVKSASIALLAGLSWGGGASAITIALIHYQTPISQLVPIYNLNTLVAVMVGLVFFSEWQDVNMVKLLTGGILVVAGASLVANA